MPQKFYTSVDLARALNLTRQATWKRIGKGEISATMAGNMWLIEAAEFNRVVRAEKAAKKKKAARAKAS